VTDCSTRSASPGGTEAIAFLAVTVALSFGVGGAVAASTRGWLPLALPVSLTGIVIASPAIVALGLTWGRGGFGAVRDLLSPLRRWRAGWRCYLVALLAPPAIHVAALWLTSAPGVGMPHELRSVPLAALPLVFLVGSAVEEVGWRGYAQPRLQYRLGPIGASLVIGSVWALWHLPLALIEGSTQGQPPFALYVVHVVALAAIFTWLYMRSEASLLLATLLHASIQASGAILPVTGTAAYPATVAITVAAAVALLWPNAAWGTWEAGRRASVDRR
jgi:uncharacterized protein